MKLKVGERLLTFRENKKLTQENMSEMIGMSISAYGRLERGETQADLTQLTRICNILGVPIQEFLPDYLTLTPNQPNGDGKETGAMIQVPIQDFFNKGNGGIIFGNFIYNAVETEELQRLESENVLLNGRVKMLEEHILHLEKLIETYDKILNHNGESHLMKVSVTDTNA